MKKYDVLAIGELCVDLIFTGLKTLPVIGHEILCENSSLVLGSSTAICASGLAKLGLRTSFVGKLGKDIFGKTTLEKLQANKIDTSNILIDESIKTGITVSLSMGTDRALVTFMGSSIDALSVEELDMEVIKSAKHIHVGSFFLQSKLRQKLPQLFKFARDHDITVSLDAGWDETNDWNYNLLEVLPYTNIFFPNENEATAITGLKNPIDAALKLSKTGCEIVVVKCGAQGAIACQKGVLHQAPAYEELLPIDTTGAGDSFNAGFIFAYLKGEQISQCLKYGNASGSISVTRVGGASSCATLEEIEELIQSRA